MIEVELYNELLSATIFLAAFLILAKAVDMVVPKLVKALVSRTSTDLDDRLLEQLRKPLFHTVIIVGVFYSQEQLVISSPLDYYIATIIKSLLVLVWAVALMNVLIIIAVDLLTTEGEHVVDHAADLKPFVQSILRVSVLAIAIFYILSLWRVDVTPILASAGVAGLAVALAAKDTLANFFGGLSLFFDQAYRVGDYVVIDDKERGEVVKIGMRSTQIRTRDNIYLSIPNSVMANSKVVNETGEVSNLRLRIRLGVSYRSDLAEVEKVLLKVANDNEHVLKDPEPKFRFRRFGESSLNVELLVWISEPMLKGRLTHYLSMAIIEEFHNNGIVIPYPQMDVHLQKGVAVEKRD